MVTVRLGHTFDYSNSRSQRSGQFEGVAVNIGLRETTFACLPTIIYKWIRVALNRRFLDPSETPCFRVSQQGVSRWPHGTFEQPLAFTVIVFRFAQY